MATTTKVEGNVVLDSSDTLTLLRWFWLSSLKLVVKLIVIPKGEIEVSLFIHLAHLFSWLPTLALLATAVVRERDLLLKLLMISSSSLVFFSQLTSGHTDFAVRWLTFLERRVWVNILNVLLRCNDVYLGQSSQRSDTILERLLVTENDHRTKTTDALLLLR